MSASRKEKGTPKMGRPRAAADAYKGSLLSVRFTAEERGALDAAAERAGVPLSKWARNALLVAAGALPSRGERNPA